MKGRGVLVRGQRRRWRVKGASAARGVVAVEFALILPLFAFILGAILSYGLYFFSLGNLMMLTDQVTSICSYRDMPKGGVSNITACISTNFGLLKGNYPMPSCTSSTINVKMDSTSPFNSVVAGSDPNAKMHKLKLNGTCTVDLGFMVLLNSLGPFAPLKQINATSSRIVCLR